MKSNMFYPMDPISILLFLQQFKGVCDTNGILEGIATWLIQYYMKRSASLTFSARLSLPPHGSAHLDGTLTSYSATVNLLLA